MQTLTINIFDENLGVGQEASRFSLCGYVSLLQVVCGRSQWPHILNVIDIPWKHLNSLGEWETRIVA